MRSGRAVPLRTWDTVLAFVRGTQTATGLVVQAIFNPGDYPTGVKVSDAEMEALNIEHRPICPTWNSTIRPRTPVPRVIPTPESCSLTRP
jgi:Rhodopirellula transposase DDE domain